MNITPENRANGTIDVTDGNGHWMTFTLDELRAERSDMTPAIAGSPPIADSDMREFMQEGRKRARALAIKSGLIPASE